MRQDEIEKLLLDQLKFGAYAENDVTDIPTGYIFTKRDIEITSPLIQNILTKNGYKEPYSSDFINKIADVFGLNINSISHINLMIPRCENGFLENEDFNTDVFDFKSAQFYIVPNSKFITNLYLIPEIVDYQKDYPEITSIEKNFSSKEENNSETGEYYKLTYWKDVPDLAQQRNQNIQTLVNRNKYLFNDNKASLVWLKVNDTLFLESLVKTFGYMNDKDLLQWVIDRTLSQRANKGEDYNSLFFMKDCSHKFIFHKKTFEVLKENINKNYLDSLLYYFNNIKENRQFQALTFEQKAQILAHLMYIGEYFVEDDKYMDYRYRFMGPFYEHSGEGDKYDTEFIKNNYYNLPKFKQIWEQAKEEGDGIGLPM